MDYICKLCNQTVLANGHFWDAHKIKIKDYFEKYEPRLTKNGEKVLFKNLIEEYFEKDFNTLTERNHWLKSTGEDESKEYILDLLIKRKLKKNWVCIPGQTQLRLANIPSILYYEKKFNLSFPDICKKIGFRFKYKNNPKVIQDINWLAPIDIIIDSREQVKINFPDHVSFSISKLDYGDYSLKNNTKIVIEKKNINDLAGTISAGFERFKRELIRAKKDKGYIVILCDSSFNDFKSIEFLPQTKKVKATYEFLAHRLRDLYEEFDCFQLCFSDGRKHSSKIAEFILKLGKKIKKIDLQLLVDSKSI